MPTAFQNIPVTSLRGSTEHAPLQFDVPYHIPMSEKRGQRGFVKVGDLAAAASPQLISGSENMVPAVDEATEQEGADTPQGRHHFRTVRQIDALSRIGEDKHPDMGSMTRMLTLCSLPRTDPGDRLQYKRTNGPYKLIMIAGGDNKLPVR